MTVTNTYFATCSKGVEDLLHDELQQLGIATLKIQTGGVGFHAELSQAYRACLWSRVASRVLLQLSEFDISSDDDLYAQVMAVDWSEHFSADETFAIDCFSAHPAVPNSHYATLRVKDAIVDQFTQRGTHRPSIERRNPDIRLNVYLSEKQCLLYLDLSGEALHKRGYRQDTGKAPLRETLAASMLYRARWKSFYDESRPLYDPMCGSGTLLIEAAMMAADIAPGLLREQFGFHHWKQFDEQLWSEILEDARQRRQDGLASMPRILGSDVDEQMVGRARSNVKACDLSRFIKVSLLDATRELTPCELGEAGLLICNPPYGKRIGELQSLRTVYLRFGKQLKRHCQGWTAAIITAEQVLAKSIGLRAFHKNTLYNGALRSVLYQYRINTTQPRLDSSVQGRSDGRQEADDNVRSGVAAASKTSGSGEHAMMFANRLRKNYKHLKKWARKNAVSCYRVYDADIPQYAVAIDKYEDWIHVQEYLAPKSVDATKAFQRVNDVIDTVADILETDQDHVVLKVRRQQKGASQYEKRDTAWKAESKRFVVNEGALKFYINIQDYIDTGLFLDHRNTRQLIRRLARGRRFLNLFAYTGSVTVYAAAGGAKMTTTVDMSNTYLQWAEDNLALNGYKGSKHQFVREDCLKWMQQAIEKNDKYQLIFIDPPTFSNSKKMDTSLDIQRDHEALLSGCLMLLADDGLILFSTNARSFKLSDALLEDCYLKEITSQTTTEDFRRKPLHRSWCLVKDEQLLRLV